MLASPSQVPLAQTTACQVRPSVHDVRELIQSVGLRFSMPRQKIIVALYDACLQEAAGDNGMACRTLLQRLHNAGIPLCLTSIRDVLRRMERKGLVSYREPDCYGLTPHALEALLG